jgi:hypothetical protein
MLGPKGMPGFGWAVRHSMQGMTPAACAATAQLLVPILNLLSLGIVPLSVVGSLCLVKTALLPISSPGRCLAVAIAFPHAELCFRPRAALLPALGQLGQSAGEWLCIWQHENAAAAVSHMHWCGLFSTGLCQGGGMA